MEHPFRANARSFYGRSLRAKSPEPQHFRVRPQTPAQESMYGLNSRAESRNDKFERKHRSPQRSSEQPGEQSFAQMALSAFRAMGGNTGEGRIDSPTPRDSTNRRLEYEIKTDWGDQNFELVEDELDLDPIYARRQAYQQDLPYFSDQEPFGSPPVSPTPRRDYRSLDRMPVTIFIRDEVGNVTSSRARRSTKLARVFAAYANGKGLKLNHLNFYLHGKRIDSSDTPASLNLRDHDKIDCVVCNTGG